MRVRQGDNHQVSREGVTRLSRIVDSLAYRAKSVRLPLPMIPGTNLLFCFLYSYSPTQ